MLRAQLLLAKDKSQVLDQLRNLNINWALMVGLLAIIISNKRCDIARGSFNQLALATKNREIDSRGFLFSSVCERL